MNIAHWKSVCSSRFQEICSEIVIEDALIDWIDIMFEQIGNASGCPPHTHTWYEFNYVLSGELITKFGKNAVRVKAGEYFLIPPGMIHSHQYVRGNPHEGLCIRWRMRRSTSEPYKGGAGSAKRGPERSFYRRLQRLKEFRPGAYTAPDDMRNQLLSFVEAAATGERSTFVHQLELAGLLDMLVAEVPRRGIGPNGTKVEGAADNSPGRSDAGTGQFSDPIVRKVEVYMEDFMKDKWNVTDLAASMHMSYGHLSRLYKERTGLTLVERMNGLRLEKARALLAQPELMIREVAERACYPDIYYFSKAFKRAYGLSPLQYRKRLSAAAVDEPALP